MLSWAIKKVNNSAVTVSTHADKGSIMSGIQEKGEPIPDDLDARLEKFMEDRCVTISIALLHHAT